MIAPELV